ncbi:hypothetical protein M9Y10_018896 [Tritrichomonas musculus]|uniref:Uncharacterized protein n=1 Tax=Tritrichomonas musculus TaxID=1915356 RepID=A0ABR2HJ14_9EUKA
MQNTLCQIEDNIPDTNRFIYKNKQYPFKFDFFKHSSKYFADHQTELENKEIIPLVDEENEGKNDLSEEGIKLFINYAQHQPIQITNETVYTLNFLSKKYEIKSLQENATKYIEKHQKELLLDILLNDSTKDKETYEDIMSDNLLEHIEDQKLLKLNLVSIYRIIIKYEEKRNLTKSSSEDDKEERDKIFTFLFKCLDKFGKDASILFSSVDFDSEKREILNKLLKEYSKSFDFHFIDTQMIQILYERENENLQKKFSQDEKIHELEETVIQLKNELNEVRTANIQLQSELAKSIQSNKSQQDEEMAKIREEMNTLRNELNQELAKQKQTVEGELISFINKTNDEVKNLVDSKVDLQKFNELKNSIEKDKKMQDEINNVQKMVLISNSPNNGINNDFFNKIDGEQQISFIEFINFNDDSSKVLNLLQFLAKEKKNSSKSNEVFSYVFLPDVNDNGCLKCIGVRSEMSDILFTNNKLESAEFTSQFDHFAEFYIEIQYQSSNYNAMYEKLIRMKGSYRSLKIAVFIKGVSDVGQNFKNNKDISFVRFDTSVTKIANYGFDGCSSLKHVIIPPSVTEIGEYCFHNCSSLKRITIPPSVTALGRYSMAHCTSLEEFVFPSSITTIRDSILYNCTSVKRIVIPSSVTSIESCAFQNCASLLEITIPPSVTKIGSSAFYGCTSLKQVTIPSSLYSSNLNISSNANIIKT